MSKRNKILVDPTVQWSIAARVLSHWTIFLLCLVLINVSVRFFTVVVDQPLGAALRAAVFAQGPVVLVMLLLLPVFLRDTLVMSNRFAGPMYRLRTGLAAMASGAAISPIKFRTDDFWMAAADDFNIVLEQFNTLKAEKTQLQAELNQLREELALVD